MKNSVVVWMLCILLTACSQKQPASFTLLLEERDITDKTIKIYQWHPDDRNLSLIMDFDLNKQYWISPNGQHIVLINRARDDSLGLPSGTMQIIDVLSNTLVDTVPEVNHFGIGLFRYNENVVWSPNSKEFVFLKSSDDGSSINLWLYDVENRAYRQLTSGFAVDHAPSWSADGQLIGFARLHVCDTNIPQCTQASATQEKRYWDIGIVNPNGANHLIMTDFSQEVFAPDMFCNLVWSPTGQYIAFETQCELDTGFPTRKALFALAIDELRVIPITHFTYASESAPVFETVKSFSFQWSDIDQLLVAYSRIPLELSYSLEGDFVGGVFIKDVPQSTHLETEKIVNLNAYASKWSPSGQYLLWFIEKRENSLWIPQATQMGKLMNDGSIIEPINTSLLPLLARCYECKAIWSPDEQYVAFVLAEENNKVVAECVVGVEKVCGFAIVSPTAETIVEITGNYRPISWVKSLRY